MRYLLPFIKKDLTKKMVLLSGPRQCGKTHIANEIIKTQGGQYFNWDFDDHKDAILKKRWRSANPKSSLIVFDELHKYGKWKNWLKGVYDVLHSEHQFLVTGSARLDTFKQGGDSLLGRYHAWRLHPFTLDEIPNGISLKIAFDRLMTVGGFPEPFLDGSKLEADRWRQERIQRVLREDVRDLERVVELENLKLLLLELRKRVGSPIVMSNLANDIGVSPMSIKRWIDIFEKMHILFQIKPYHYKMPRALKKPPKIYFYDNADVIGDDGARLENLVATHLYKQMQFKQDALGEDWDMYYLRDREDHEVDFMYTLQGKVKTMYEVKYSEKAFSRSLYYYADKLQPEQAFQLSASLDFDGYSKGRLEMRSAIEYFSNFKYEVL